MSLRTGAGRLGTQFGKGKLGSRAVAAMCSQAFTAGGSLILQLIAAHTLGLAGYGAYALCLSLLGTATAWYTGYVGDGLTVLNRSNPRIRGGLSASALIILTVSFLASIAMVYALGLGSGFTAEIYAVMVVCWLLEETGRRVLMARLEFWGLVVNDAVYTGVTLLVLGGFILAGNRDTLALMLTAMTVGALAAVGAALVQLPRAEYESVRPSTAGLSEVAAFGIWRCLHASLRPLQLLVARVLLLQLVSLTAVGLVESGRLVVAPMQTVINGAAGVLLSTAAMNEKRGQATVNRLTERATVLLVSVTLVGGIMVALLSHPIGRLMTGRPVPMMLVLGWVAYLTAWAASLPSTTELVARKQTRFVFVARLADSGLGLLLVVSFLALGFGADLTPWLLAVGGAVSVFWTRRQAVLTRPAKDTLDQKAASGRPRGRHSVGAVTKEKF